MVTDQDPVIDPTVITIDPESLATLAANQSAALNAFAPVLAKAFFDEYFARLSEVNAAQISLQSALSANAQVISLQNQIQNLQDNNALIANVSQVPTSQESSVQIQTARNNFQITQLQARLATAQAASRVS